MTAADVKRIAEAVADELERRGPVTIKFTTAADIKREKVDAESARLSREIDAAIARMNAQTITSGAVFLNCLKKTRDLIDGRADDSKRAEK